MTLAWLLESSDEIEAAIGGQTEATEEAPVERDEPEQDGEEG